MKNAVKIGDVIINKDFFKGWKFTDFEKYIKSSNIEKSSGLSVTELAKRLDVDVPKKKEGDK